jgi:peptidoglycan/xylan/chitin deacetylase (PgdA/CDA1 family)
MYHRVASVRRDPWGLSVSPEHFERQISYLKKYHRPLSMTELIQRLRDKTLPSNAVAITFDDGYRDNLINAEPVLSKLKVPATVFVATDFVDRNSPFWWDELAAMILECTQTVRFVEHCHNESFVLSWGAPDADDRAGTWRACNGPTTERQRSYLQTWGKLQRCTDAERAQVMSRLRTSLAAIPDPLSLPMSSDEIRALLASDVLSLGAHSASHPALASVEASERMREISESAKACHALSGRKPDGFAYPYGDVNTETRDEVIRAGFDWACSTRNAFLDEASPDIYSLPRLAASDVPIRQFVEMIGG